VIDIGCNDGSLLQYLKEKNNIDGRGMEIDQNKVQLCLSKGISVIEGDADVDLFDYPDNLFDFSILTYALQATKSPKTVLSQLVRISKKSIISFPNFGHWKIGTSLLLNRKMPVSNKLSYSWHETPNLHFCTINDFIDLCEETNINIEVKADLKNYKLSKYNGKNLFDSYFSEAGLFLISKK
ncbi:uncharacterized protein METZ01_LOCUS64413, partial [marine metagenome]